MPELFGNINISDLLILIRPAVPLGSAERLDSSPARGVCYCQCLAHKTSAIAAAFVAAAALATGQGRSTGPVARWTAKIVLEDVATMAQRAELYKKFSALIRDP